MISRGPDARRAQDLQLGHQWTVTVPVIMRPPPFVFSGKVNPNGKFCNSTTGDSRKNAAQHLLQQ